MTDFPIDTYLDDVVSLGRTLPPRRLRSLIAETEEHLRDAALEAEREGRPRLDAEQHVVAAFGPASDLVAGERAVVAPWTVLAARVALTGLLLAGVGAIAVGLSGVLSGLIRAVGGDSALVDGPSVGAMTASNCARWLAITSGGDCRSAAVSDWADETVYYRIALGVLGVIAVVAARWVQRRTGRVHVLDQRTGDTIACTLFVAAAVVTTALTVQRVAGPGTGWGQWSSAAVAASAGAAMYARRLIPELRRSPG